MAGVERRRPPPPPLLKSELRLEPEETEWLPRMKREEVEVEEVEITSVGIASRLVLVNIVKK